MHLAYIDESGDSGLAGSRTYTLGCVLVDAARWPDVFDELIEFRRFLKRTLGVPVRAEIKANYLMRNGGPFRKLHLNEMSRRGIYRMTLGLIPKLDLRAFAVVVDKQAHGLGSRELCWEFLLQRLERFSTKGLEPIMLVHDEGDPLMIRKLTRKARRAGIAGSMFGTGVLKRPATMIVDDPVSRRSDQSYFLQFADLVAYSAFRKIHPPPPRVVNIVDDRTWDRLGSSAYQEVNKFSGGPPGIVSI